MNKKRRVVIRSFDDFVEEAGMMPTLDDEISWQLNPLEQYFMDVADKHGVIDEILDGDNDYEGMDI